MTRQAVLMFACVVLIRSHMQTLTGQCFHVTSLQGHIAGVEMGGAGVKLLLALVLDLQGLYNYIDMIP
jgi:hypothetical protein